MQPMFYFYALCNGLSGPLRASCPLRTFSQESPDTCRFTSAGEDSTAPSFYDSKVSTRWRTMPWLTAWGEPWAPGPRVSAAFDCSCLQGTANALCSLSGAGCLAERGLAEDTPLFIRGQVRPPLTANHLHNGSPPSNTNLGCNLELISVLFLFKLCSLHFFLLALDRFHCRPAQEWLLITTGQGQYEIVLKSPLPKILVFIFK